MEKIKKNFKKGMRLGSALRSQTGRSCDLGQDAERERIFNKLMGWASEFNDEADENDENDYEENVLRIDTAIWCAIDE